MPSKPKTDRVNEARWIESRQRWQINVQRDGERRTFTDSTPGTKGKVAAEKAADDWLTGNRFDNKVRFQKLWDSFLVEMENTTGTANYKQHEYIGRIYLLPTLKHNKVANITSQNWQDCITEAYKKGRSKKTCQVIKSSITRFYRYAKKCRITMDYPEDLIIPNNAPVKEKTILQPDNLKKLFEIDYVTVHNKKVPAFFINAWRFIVVTGLRRGELCGIMDKKDIDGHCLTISRSINGYNEETLGKNNNARRKIVLGRWALSIIDDQKQMLKKHGIVSPWLFPDESGQRLHPHHLYHKWETYRDQHEIKCSIHEMRHTMISLAKNDMPEQLLKQIVGHSKSMDTFGIYGHSVDGELERAANYLDKVFDGVLS